MPDTDWMPNPQGKRKTFFENFAAKAGAVATSLGLDFADAIAAATKWVGSYTTYTDARDVADGAAKAVSTQSKLTDSAIRAAVRLLKATPGVTPEMLAALQVLGEDVEATAHADAQAPVLVLVLVGGRMEVKFTKHGHQGIMLYSRRGTETEWTKLGLDTQSPYVDTRPNLVPGQPEDRHYRAFFTEHDQEVGELSAEFTIAVRG